jgi:PAS domain S-box-containing protein
MPPIIEYLDVAGIVAAAIAIPIAFWRKFIIPINKMFTSNEELIHTVQQIKSEVVTNGGKSIKDTVNGLKQTCENIEKRQRVIDQRTRASLHYLDAGLFETDKTGKLTWTNEAFYKITGQTQTDMEGYDWLSFIHEDEREQVIKEFSSCLKMSRKFYVETKTMKGKNVILSGYAYKLGEDQNGGYLINIIQL